MVEKIKILWLTIDRSMRVTGHFDYFREAVSKIADVKAVFKSTKSHLAGRFSKLAMSGVIQPKKLITKKLAREHWDFVMIDALFAYMSDNLKLLHAPKGFVIEDNHDVVPKWQVTRAKEQGIDCLFHRGLESFHRFHPEAREMYDCIWQPFAVNTDIFYDRQRERKGVLHVGQVGQKHYPIRVQLIERLSKHPWFTRVVRPNETAEKTPKWPVREDYAELINQSQIAVTCGSRYDAAVQKFFEIPACGTVLMSNWFRDLGALGFENGKNIVTYEEPIEEQIKLMLENPQRLRRIGEAGRQLMLEKHTMEIRAREFIEEVKRIIR
jgi:glycosyltransferase involved in cell wall biosynthesis